MIKTTQTANRLSLLGSVLILLGAASTLYPMAVTTELADGFSVLGLLLLFLGLYCRIAASRLQ